MMFMLTQGQCIDRSVTIRSISTVGVVTQTLPVLYSTWQSSPITSGPDMSSFQL